MTVEAARYLEKARQCLSNARSDLGIDLSNAAGRNAYLAAFLAARAFIFERTGRAAKTHQGIQIEFSRSAKDEAQIDKDFPAFLSQAYNLKAVADYENGAGFRHSKRTSSGGYRNLRTFSRLHCRIDQ